LRSTPEPAQGEISAPIKLPATHGEQGVDLALNAQDQPFIAHRIPKPSFELAYVSCKANCETSTDGWGPHVVLPSAAAASKELGKLCFEGQWFAGRYPEVAVGAGKVHIVFEVEFASMFWVDSYGRYRSSCPDDLKRFPRLTSVDWPN
jgi:hypothetical protein